MGDLEYLPQLYEHLLCYVENCNIKGYTIEGSFDFKELNKIIFWSTTFSPGSSESETLANTATFCLGQLVVWRSVLYSIQTCFVLYPDLFCTTSRPALYYIKTCSVLHQDLLCTLSRLVLYSIQICAVLHHDLFCTLYRPVLYSIKTCSVSNQTCFLLHPDLFYFTPIQGGFFQLEFPEFS